MKKFKVAIYLRISREDLDKNESESISNQRAMLKSFVEEREDLELISIKVDDGYSGSNFERPAFKELMEDVKNRKVNCIVVKDFSRFGRNFVEVGKYIEEIFPFMNVRFIAINDNYDSIQNKSENSLLVPFRNLMNDAFLRDISIKTRTQLDSKRKNGEFIGSFATYGYLKDPNNKNKLIIDEYASKVVEEIFKLKLEGFSHNKIAEKLNSKGILSPMEYKKSIGLNFKNGFKTKSKALWNHNSIIRILKNPVYIGVLEQAKFKTLNYKIKKKVENSKDNWIVCENSHEPIIDKLTFENVQKLMLTDTRVAPNNDKVFLLSGLLYCADCGRTLIRKNYGTKENRYIYYVCSGAFQKSVCTRHSIRDILVEDVILKSIKLHIKNVIQLEEVLKSIENLPYTEKEIKKIDIDIINNKKELEKLKKNKFRIYEDYKDGLLDKSEYFIFSKNYDEKIKNIKNAIINLENELSEFINGNTQKQEFIQYFKEYKNINKIDRKIVVSLIDKVYVYENLKLVVKFKFDKEYNRVLNFIESLKLLQEVV